MAKRTTVYICNECGYETQKWLGKCPNCNTYNTFTEEDTAPALRSFSDIRPAKVEQLSGIELSDENRMESMIEELDRVLSGGIVEGSLTLISGEPGIGKSTLLLQLCQNISGLGDRALYISGEESARQIKMRADRLGVVSSNLYIAAETELSRIEQAVCDLRPKLLVIDSIQTMSLEELPNAAGSVTQIRECTVRLMRLAKIGETAVILVGHVTKEGGIAGPRILEHIVDTVLYFEGEKSANYRIIRAVKNRFGSTNELGIFEMTGQGLIGIANPSEYMLSGRPINVPGSVVSCTVEGTRPILTEIQALLCPTSFGQPRRSSSGADFNRVVMLLAVLEKRIGLQLGGYDAYVNIAGGMRITEPAADAAIAAAVASSFRNKHISPDTIVFGEVGLAGEIRAVSFSEKRLAEAAKLGFRHCVLPQANLKGLQIPKGINVMGVGNVNELLDVIMY